MDIKELHGDKIKDLMQRDPRFITRLITVRMHRLVHNVSACQTSGTAWAQAAHGFCWHQHHWNTSQSLYMLPVMIASPNPYDSPGIPMHQHDLPFHHTLDATAANSMTLTLPCILLQQLDKQMHSMMHEKEKRRAQIQEDQANVDKINDTISSHVQPQLVSCAPPCQQHSLPGASCTWCL